MANKSRYKKETNTLWLCNEKRGFAEYYDNWKD